MIDWPIDARGVELIKSAEGCRLTAYQCPAGIWTIGWGHTGPDVRPGMTITQGQADALLAADIRRFADGVRSACRVPPTALQLAAMVSLSYNIGLRAFRESTALRFHNVKEYDSAAKAFGLWSKARVDGRLVELPGLVKRRAAEAALYLADGTQHASPVVDHSVTAPAKEQTTMPPIIPILSAVLPVLQQAAPALGRLFGSGSEVAERNVAAAQVAASGVPFWRQPVFIITLALLPLVYMVAAAVLFGDGWSTEIRASVVSALITGALGSIGGYWLGTSASSARKDDALINRKG